MFVSLIRMELSPDLRDTGQDKQLIKTSDPCKILVFFYSGLYWKTQAHRVQHKQTYNTILK